MSCGTQTFNVSGMDCFAQCNMVYAAYISLLTGKRKIRVRQGQNWVEYQPALASDAKALKDLYSTLRSQCPEAMANLPDLDTGQRVKRGPPGYGYART